MASPFQRLQKQCDKHHHNNVLAGNVVVKRKDLETALKFLKYHRQWRLYDGHIAAGTIKPNAKVARRIDKRRIKYYTKLYGVNLKDIAERVTKYMRDALHGGGNTEDPINIVEAYLYPEKYNVQNIRRRRKTKEVRQLQKPKRRARSKR